MREGGSRERSREESSLGLGTSRRSLAKRSAGLGRFTGGNAMGLGSWKDGDAALLVEEGCSCAAGTEVGVETDARDRAFTAAMAFSSMITEGTLPLV